MAIPNFLGTELYAVTSLFTWLAPHIFIEISELRLGLFTSSFWEDPEKRAQGDSTITYHSFLSSSLCLALISGTAAGIALSTRGLDVEMLYVLAGLSRLLSAVVLFLLSFMIPEWLSIYYSNKKAGSLGKSLKSLRVTIWWSILRYHFLIYFFLLPFFCNVRYPALIPTSIIAGILFGFMIIAGVYYGRSKFKTRKRSIAITLIIALIIVSSLAFAMGCNFIYRVWRQGKWSGVIIIAFFACLIAQSSFHIIFWFWSVKKKKRLEDERCAGQQVESVLFKTTLFSPGNISHAPNSTTTAPIQFTVIENEEIMQDNGERSDTQEIPDLNDVKISIHSGIEQGSNECDVDRPETYLTLIGEKCKCRTCPLACIHTSKANKGSAAVRLKIFLKWTIWFVGALCSLYVTVINIGGMYQYRASSKHFEAVDDILYNHMNDGDVCGFNESGTEGPPIVITFSNAEEAIASNFTIAHCGKCGACSNPPNLKLEWTTRHQLAELSQNCVKQAFFSKATALQCMMDNIGFDKACSECWLTDGLCSMNHCTFLYLQQMIVNKMTNFAVAQGMKNAATCEEAMCESVFVPCSGANRRRMNIKSDIMRPRNQQCQHVNDTLWINLFGLK